MQLYAITDRRLFPNEDALLARVTGWANNGVDYIQIREKDLEPHALQQLTSSIIGSVARVGKSTKVLLNGPLEMALATGCHGVHLPSNAPAARIAEAKALMEETVISVSCHTFEEIELARDHGASLVLFAPVFEKRVEGGVISGQGLDALAGACRVAAPVPVIALGGVTVRNAADCLSAGAAGVAGIRLFVGEDWRGLR